MFDWYFCLACFVVILVFVVALDVFFYLRLSSDADNVVPTSTTPDTYVDRGAIESVASGLRAKDQIASSPSAEALRDPSAR